LPLNRLRGFKELNPDEELAKLLNIASEVTTNDDNQYLSKNYESNTKFKILQNWLNGEITILSNAETKDEVLLNYLFELSNGLGQLADNQPSDFFQINRVYGNRKYTTDQTDALLMSAAYYNFSCFCGNKDQAELWWKEIKKHSELKLPSNLRKYTENIGENANYENLRGRLLGFYAVYIDASDDEASEHSKILKDRAEEILLNKHY
jgi:hypothetical protein